MQRNWNILVVDDEADVHTATQLALKYTTWKGRSFQITSAHSGEEATQLLSQDRTAAQNFDVAIVDVVMETDDAGLRLCEFIRQELSRSLRIILRTGQPGVAPEERILNDYDIDYYLSKGEVTKDRLFATVRACLRQLSRYFHHYAGGGSASELC